MALLKTTDLSIGYQTSKLTKVIASNISFSLEKSSLVGVIGINGSGKSTLLRTISGLQPLLSGQININQKDLATLSQKSLSNILALVLTEQGISANLRVKELVALGRQPYTNWIGQLTNEDRLHIEQALNQVDITSLANRYCYELSDGQLQKVLIARALAQNTKLIILDEPTTHLDLHHKAYVVQLLKKLTQTTKKTIVFATHEINLALSVCDQIILIDQNKVTCKSPEQLIKDNHLESIFPKDLIRFNASTKQFTIVSN